MSEEIFRIIHEDYFDYVLCKAWERTRYPRDNPKSIGVTEVTQCLLYSYFQRKDPICVPQVVPLLLGVKGHEIMADIFKEAGWIVEMYVCVEGNAVRLCGRVDLYHPDEEVVADLKFVEKPPDEPYPDHVAQIQTYIAMLRKNKFHVSNGLLVYYSRDPSYRTKVFIVHPRDSILNEMMERAKMLSEALIKDEPPKPEQGRWCRWCPYKFRCYELRGKKREKNFRPLLVDR